MSNISKKIQIQFQHSKIEKIKCLSDHNSANT